MHVLFVSDYLLTKINWTKKYEIAVDDTTDSDTDSDSDSDRLDTGPRLLL